MRDGGSVMALDMATSCGVAEGTPGGSPRCCTPSFRVEGGDHSAVGEKALTFFADRLTLDPPSVIFIERPGLHSVAKGRSTVDTIFRLYGLCFLGAVVARCRGVADIRFVEAGEVRKHFLGSGNIPGPDAKRLVQARCRELGYEFGTPDEADALALWDYGCEQVKPGSGNPASAGLSGQMTLAVGAAKRQPRKRLPSAAAKLFAKRGRR